MKRTRRALKILAIEGPVTVGLQAGLAMGAASVVDTEPFGPVSREEE